MMEIKSDEISHGQNEHFEIVRLPYLKKCTERSCMKQASGFYFNILIPRKRFGLAEALQKLDATALNGLFSGTGYKKVHVSLK
jgi:hypothetical protein